MGVDPAVLAALEMAVAADPTNTAVRTHLSQLLLESDEPARALEHLRTVLAAQPSDLTALTLAVRAATLVGQTDLAAGYAQLVRALSAPSAQPLVTATPTPDPPGAASTDLDVELEALLHNEDMLDVEAPPLTLADVGGMDDVKREVERTFLGPMRNPELRKMYRKSLRGGLLLYGPPGCGKTFLARAIAGELGANFLSVGLHEVLDMYLGQSERNIHDLFDRARRNTPCVLFLDEVDALGQKRTNLARSAARNAVVQLLAELDGVDDENEGLFVLGATNQPWDIDPAMRRPGRFDRTVLVVPPDKTARTRIFELHLRDRPIEQIDYKTLARKTDRFSGADIRLVCETAAEFAIEDSLSSGRARAITNNDLERAIARTTPSTLPWFDVARNFVTFANPSGEYDQLLDFMRTNKLL